MRPRENDVLFTKFAEISVATEEQSDGLLPRESLRQLLLGYPHIISAWEHWQRFNEIWLSKTEKQAETQFIAWLAGIPDEFPGFKKFGKELELWNKEFLNYFDWKRATNGTAEWINNIIRRCYSRYKRKWNLQEFTRIVCAEVDKNKPTATCIHCGGVCYPDLVDGTNLTKYINYKQITPVARPRKNFRKNAIGVREVFCRLCQMQDDDIEDEKYETATKKNTARQGRGQQNRPYTSRDLNVFLEELRRDPRYIAWVEGGKKLRKAPKGKNTEKDFDAGQTNFRFG